jgi:hypothetical protein
MNGVLSDETSAEATELSLAGENALLEAAAQYCPDSYSADPFI